MEEECGRAGGSLVLHSRSLPAPRRVLALPGRVVAGNLVTEESANQYQEHMALCMVTSTILIEAIEECGEEVDGGAAASSSSAFMFGDLDPSPHD